MTVQPQQPPKARRGCFFYGCIAGVVCLVAMLLAVLLGLHMVKKFFNEYTDTKPVPLPALELPASRIEEVKGRVDAFRDAVNAGRPTSPLELTGDDINALIAGSPSFQPLKDKVYVRIERDQVHGEVSVPMDQIGLPMFRGRYLNGSANFRVALQDGVLQVSPLEITVKGKPLPGVYMQRLRNENLAAGANQDPRSLEGLKRLEKIEVKDGKLILMPRQEPRTLENVPPS